MKHGRPAYAWLCRREEGAGDALRDTRLGIRTGRSSWRLGQSIRSGQFHRFEWRFGEKLRRRAEQCCRVVRAASLSRGGPPAGRGDRWASRCRASFGPPYVRLRAVAFGGELRRGPNVAVGWSEPRIVAGKRTAGRGDRWASRCRASFGPPYVRLRRCGVWGELRRGPNVRRVVEPRIVAGRPAAGLWRSVGSCCPSIVRTTLRLRPVGGEWRVGSCT